MADIIYAYPFDPTAAATTNKIISEKQTLIPPDWKDYYFVIPKFAPFFEEGLELYVLPEGRKLEAGKDYVLSHLFHDASLAVGKPVYGSITFYDRSLTGVLEQFYQTLGGEWTIDEQTANEILINHTANPRITTWESVVELPSRFPVIDHEWDLDDMVGMTEVRDAIASIAVAMGETTDNLFAEHLERTDNPHAVTKAQVGLGNVANYPAATQAEAEIGLSNTRFMTPLRTSNAINIQALQPLNNHTSDITNPHQVTKGQVGLGEVEDHPVATKLQAEDGLTNQAYMTPLRTKEAITKQTEPLQAHLLDATNPHNVTPAQIGAVTESEVAAMIQGTVEGEIIAFDSERFGGLFPNEWGASFVGNSDLEALAFGVQDEFTLASMGMSSLAVSSLPFLPPITGVLSISAAAGRYYGTLNDGGVLEAPADNIVPDSLDSILMVVAGVGGAYVLNGDSTVTAYDDGVVTTMYDPPVGLVDVYEISVGRSHVFALKTDGTMVAWGDVNTASLRAIDPADNVNVGYVTSGDTNNAVVVHTDGTFTPLGNANFITNVSAVLAAETDIQTLTLGAGFLVVLHNDTTISAYAITDPEGAATFDEVTLGVEFANVAGISCWGSHFLVRRNDGGVAAYGDNTYGQCDVPDFTTPISRIAAGEGFSLALRSDGLLEFWGDDKAGALTPPLSYQGN